MKKRVILFMVFLLGLSSINIISPTNIFSSRENRYLQGLPKLNYNSIMSGKYGREFETYTTDQFVFRDKWTGLKTLGDLSLLKKDNGRVYFGKEDYLFQVHRDIDEKELNKKIENINQFAGEMDKLNIRMNYLLVPSKSTVLRHRLPPYAPVVDEAYIVNKLQRELSPSLNIIDLTAILKEKSHEDIYYRTDHHWTTKGAFYGYEHYMKSIGEGALGEGEFNIREVSNGFWGTLYRKANFYSGYPDTIYMYESTPPVDMNIWVNGKEEGNNLYDEGFLDKTDKYSYFLGGDKALMEIETSIQNNKIILIIKDSFANSMIPFLTNHYNRIIIVDPRYFKGNIVDLVKESKVQEVLFIYNIQNT